MNVAILSPNENAYSETFIKAHKDYLKDNVYYYYGHGLNKKLDGQIGLISRVDRWIRTIFKMVLRQSNERFRIETLKKSFKNNEIDAVLVEYGTHAYYAKEFLKELDIPILVHFHGYDASVGEVIATCESYEEVFRFTSYVFVV